MNQSRRLYRVSDVSARPNDGKEALAALAAAALGLPPDAILSVRIRRRSLDARRKPRIRAVHALDVETDREAPGAVHAPPDPPSPLDSLQTGSEKLHTRPVIVGAGPAGLCAALVLARVGFRPLVVERGKPAHARGPDVEGFWRGAQLDPESNILFGEGGAGAFSDGKLGTRTHDPLLDYFFSLLVEAGAPESVSYEARPHLGTSGVRVAASGLRRLAEQAGAEFRFGSRVMGLDFDLSGVRAAVLESGLIETRALVLASGGSAEDVFGFLVEKGVALESKPFQAGLRVEHSQAFVDRMQYGDAAGSPGLPPAEYRFSERTAGQFRSVFTFCMCPGGMVVPAVNMTGRLSTNGMSDSGRCGPRANAAFVVTVQPPSGGALAGLELRARIEKAGYEAGGSAFAAPAQAMPDFLRGSVGCNAPVSSFPMGVRPADLGSLLPEGAAGSIRQALAALGRRIPGFASAEATLTGPETRTSSPVRILRDPSTLESLSHGGLYPCGEGAGYAGGISSAGVDGIRAALALARRFKP